MGLWDFTKAVGTTINPFDGGRTYGDYYRDKYMRDVQSQDPTQVRGSINGKYYNFAGDFIGTDPSYKPPSTAPKTDSNDTQMANLQAELRALRNSQPYIPQLPSFDILGNYKKAKASAESQVNPLYQKKLTDFLSNQNRLKTQKQKSAGLERNEVAAQLQELIDSNALKRTRTDEDTNLAIDQINTQEGQFQDDEGQINDLERTQVIQDLATAGLTTSGLGRKRVADQQRVRNVTSERQLDAFNQDRDARELYRTRTFEDLANSDVLGQSRAGRQNEAIDLDLESYMDDLAYQEKTFRLGNELDRIGAVLNATESNRQTGVEEFIASLINGGRRAEDIQLARSIYL